MTDPELKQAFAELLHVHQETLAVLAAVLIEQADPVRAMASLDGLLAARRAGGALHPMTARQATSLRAVFEAEQLARQARQDPAVH